MHEKKDKAILPDPSAYLRRRVVATINRVYLRLTKSFPAAPIADIEDSVAEAVAQWWAQRGALDDPRMETWVSMNARWRLLDRLRRVGEHVPLSEHHLVAQGPQIYVERTEILRHAVCITFSTAIVWNGYPGVDYRLVWSGDSPDNDGCEPRGNLPSQPGKIAIRAADYGRNQEFAIAVNTYPDIDRAYIEFYRRSGPGAQDRPWGFDHTQNILDFDTVLMHELGHALGFPHHTPPPNSVMKGGLHYTMHRVLWEEDIFKLRDTSQTYHYDLRTNRQIRRKYSTNNGLSWSTGTSLQEYTNANIAVAYDPWSGENLVAWAGAEPAHRVHTLRCNNLTCDPATRVVHSGSSTHYGVVSNIAAALACHSSKNQCLLMWVNQVVYHNSPLSYSKAGSTTLYGSGYYFSGGDIASDLPPSLTHGNGHWVAAWRGKASTLPARAMRMADGNWPYWSDLTVIDTSVQSSPTVAFVGNSFVYYYIKY